jgi:RNA polymerase primary sigma factor
VSAVAAGSDLAAEIASILGEAPGSPARTLARRLGLRKTQVNQVLYRRRDLFMCEGDAPPRWFVRDDSPPAHNFDGLAARVVGRLYAWQREALGAWLVNHRRGIVQAVTGAGKTELGLAAIETHLAGGGKAAVIVPGIDLARQWEARIRERLPTARLGVMGDGSHATLDEAEVLVAVARSASRSQMGLNGDQGLLVADEVHRYATSRYMEALEEGFEARLGLTATLDRDDGAHSTHLLPYFGSLVYTLGYERALADGVIAPYKVAVVGVSLTHDEDEEYQRLTQQMTAARTRLIREHGARDQPFQAFLTDVTWMSRHGDRSEGVAAGRWLTACRARRALLAEASEKVVALDALTPSLRFADRSLVFTETIGSAEAVASRLRVAGVRVEAIHSKVRRPERRRVLGDFAAGELHTVVAPRVLDEGIDVPEADLAVVLAASQSRRQMIQRMGRVLRRKADDRRARFVIVYVRGSSDDPDDVSYEGQHDELLDAADEEEWFNLRDADRLAAYLAPDT